MENSVRTVKRTKWEDDSAKVNAEVSATLAKTLKEQDLTRLSLMHQEAWSRRSAVAKDLLAAATVMIDARCTVNSHRQAASALRALKQCSEWTRVLDLFLDRANRGEWRY